MSTDQDCYTCESPVNTYTQQLCHKITQLCPSFIRAFSYSYILLIVSGHELLYYIYAILLLIKYTTCSICSIMEKRCLQSWITNDLSVKTILKNFLLTAFFNCLCRYIYYYLFSLLAVTIYICIYLKSWRLLYSV